MRRDPKPYDVSMWLRRCPKGVRSCFKAQGESQLQYNNSVPTHLLAGNWDEQKPIFRGCAGAKYEHGTKCKRELQRVQVTPGKPRVSGDRKAHITNLEYPG
jgi:hypothetical protein